MFSSPTHPFLVLGLLVEPKERVFISGTQEKYVLCSEVTEIMSYPPIVWLRRETLRENLSTCTI